VGIARYLKAVSMGSKSEHMLPLALMTINHAALARLSAHAKARMLRYYDRAAAPASVRKGMAAAINSMFAELPQRDNAREAMTVTLDDTTGLDYLVGGRSWQAYPCKDALAVTTIVPGWTRGWRHLISDDIGYDEITWFLHFARQYIHRSHVAKLLMICWDRDSRILHPFGSQFMSRHHWKCRQRPERSLIEESKADAQLQWGSPDRELPIRSVWATANTLDANLHQSIFHFIRGQSLLRKEFELEAVVALDSALQALKTLLVKGGIADSGTTRPELCTLLGLGLDAGEIARQGNFLRNNVGAHAGGWRWWDYGELTEELVPALSSVVRRAIAKAAKQEPGIRTVEPEPENWSTWLLQNFDMLWDTVWFEKALIPNRAKP
jgi:hypothetical protein